MAAIALVASIALGQLPHEEVFEHLFQLVPGRLLLTLDGACLSASEALAAFAGVLAALGIDSWLGRRRFQVTLLKSQ